MTRPTAPTRATLKIVNLTPWRSDHLRAITVQCRSIVFGDEPKRLIVTFKRGRGPSQYATGHASLRGSRSTVFVPPSPDKAALASVIAHELAHNAGVAGERWMRRSKLFGTRTEGWRDLYAWAEAMPLERKPAPVAAPVQDRYALKLATLDAREKAWRSKAKRAATALRKIARSRGYYQRKLAAFGRQP